MKKLMLILTLMLAFVSVSMAQDPGWPRQKTSSAGRLVYYQPQVDSWNNYRDVQFRMAFSLTPTGGKQVVGVVQIKSNTDINIDARTVLLSKPEVIDTHFPSLDSSKAGEMDQLVRTFLPPGSSVVISLDRLIASADKTQPAATVSVRNDAPVIFVSNKPAMLVQVDGDPVLADIKDTKIQFIVNTNWPIFFDKSHKTYYLFTGKQWLSGSNLTGPWVSSAKLPKDMLKVAKDPQWAGLAKSISPTAIASGPTPTVFYSTGPAEVILFKGQPVYSKITGTDLVFASNTDADLFVYVPSQQYFYLAAGRWFSSVSLQGPWTYATADLPADFAKIPVDSPAARVLVSVPGTEQAKDAVLLAQVPTTVEIDPKAAAAQAHVAYSGNPEFKPIEGTSLSYAVNTSDKVIKAGDAYYLCLKGVWFLSSNAQGPWQTATSIPQEIYTIPPSSPVYNVTYVTQTVTSSGTVQSSYTAGYMGTFIVGVGVGAFIACGTGYYYPPYIYYPAYGYPIYHYYPVTYGYGAFYNSYTGAYGVARGVYGPYGGATGWAAYNPYTGTYARGGTVYGPYGSASVARAYNPYTGVGAATRQGSSPYAQWGSSVISNGNRTVQTGHISTAQGTIAGARSTTGAAVIGGSGGSGSGGLARTSGGDLYAAKDGQIYKNTGDGWHSYNNGSWDSVNKPTPQSTRSRASSNSAPRPEMQSLNQEWKNRQRGAMQTQNFESFRRSGGAGSGRTRSGGGYRGGGRRR
ncbi:MAG TPA: hypothetical protein VFD48_02380 [Pyrinomonadaceae bacterium]|nr:hypothetical protein [Pyrinomonadaceae bacterium]